MRYLAAPNVTDGSEVTMQTLRHLDASLWPGAGWVDTRWVDTARSAPQRHAHG
jgi:hypothetical protein